MRFKANHKRLIILTVILSAFVGFFLFASGRKPTTKTKRPQENIIADKVLLYQYFQNNKPFDSILISIPLTKDLKNPANFTAYLDVNADDKFDENERAVDGVPALVEKHLPNTFPIMFGDSKLLKKLVGLPEEAKVKAKIKVGDSTTEVKAEKVHVEVGKIFNPAPGLIGNTFEVFTADQLKLPVNNDGVPDLDGRKGKPNECVPISMSNSLLWLAKKHGFAEKLPKTTDDLIDELAKDLKWSKDGVKKENILPGKEKFSQRRDLPLENKKIDDETIEGESQLWKRIVKELNKGEDVELIIDFKDSPKGRVDKSHAVTVVGADKNKKGKKFLTFHDPVTKEGNDSYEVDRNGQILGYPFGKTYVNFIISESFAKLSPTPTPTPTSTPSPSPSSKPTPTNTPTATSPPAATLTPTSTHAPTAPLTPTPETTPSPTS